jgi:hypothetical protein
VSRLRRSSACGGLRSVSLEKKVNHHTIRVLWNCSHIELSALSFELFSFLPYSNYQSRVPCAESLPQSHKSPFYAFQSKIRNSQSAIDTFSFLTQPFNFF